MSLIECPECEEEFEYDDGSEYDEDTLNDSFLWQYAEKLADRCEQQLLILDAIHGGDKEKIGAGADELICAFLREAGFGRIATTYENLGTWRA